MPERNPGKWIKATRQEPCPVCEKTDWCTRTADGQVIHCRRGHALAAPTGFRRTGDSEDGAAQFVAEGEPDSLAYDPAVYRVPAVSEPVRTAPLRNWAADAAEFEAAARDRLSDLAEDLEVPVEALRALGAGWTGRAWSFPSRDGRGEIVGISTRDASGGKRAITSSRLALFYAPDRWHQGDGPLYVVEGPSDTAALTGLGLAAVGRPSNTGGAACLAVLLREWPEDRGIIVVSERDEKPDGRWPGRDGAVRIAETLAEMLYRPIAWTLPPEGIKDSRDYAARATAAEIDAAYKAAAAIVPGKPRPIHEVAVIPTEEPRDLADYRREGLDAKRSAVREAGVYVDRSPTGAGKTHSTIAALLEVGRAKTVTALPTHANVRERAEEMLAAGHAPRKVGVVPELTEENCAAFEAASAARAAGLSHGLAVCIKCPHRKGCEYLRLKAQAERRQHLITTAEHFTRSAGTASMGSREVVVIDEKPDLTIAPRVYCHEEALRSAVAFLDEIVAEGNAQALLSLADWAADPGPRADAGVEAASAAAALRQLAEEIFAVVDATEGPGIAECPIEPAGLSKDWQRRISRMMTSRALRAPPEEAMRLLAAIEGEEARAWVCADRTPDGHLTRTVVATWRVDLAGKRVLLLDGTADVAGLARLAGEPVADITPAGHLGALHAVVQRPIRISRGVSPARVRDIVEAVIEESEWQRVGLIGLRPHIEPLTASEGPDALSPEIRARVAKTAYFGQGPDRASNEWHRDCDALLVIGTPRPNPGDVRRLLAVEGNVEAARLPDGGWGDGTWTATTVTGDEETLASRGYTDPAWRAAHQAITRAGLLQAVGRARAGLPEGIPALVIADEPLGLPVDARPLTVRSRTARKVLEALRAAESGFFSGETQDSAAPDAGGSARPRNGGKSPIRIGGAGDFPIEDLPPFRGRRFWEVVRDSGLDRKSVRRALDHLADEGAVHQPAPGFWALGPAPAELAAPLEDRPAGLGRPPEIEARVEAARATIERVASDSPDRIVTTGAYVQAAASAARTAALKGLSEAVEAREVVRLDRGLYAPDLPVARVESDSIARAWIADPRPGHEAGEPIEIVVTTRGEIARVTVRLPAGETEPQITLLGNVDREIPHEAILGVTARRRRAK